MITKTTNLNGDYTSFWAKIKKASEKDLASEHPVLGRRIDINNLEEYFGQITDIAKLNNHEFLRLPLDEPMLEIDANSRKIDTSKFTGIQVQGDHLAETLFFCIDRYFDYVDLATKNIRVNWKTNVDSQRSVVDDFIKSTEIIPGKIVFGWTLTKEMTQKNGTLNFAVEFYGDGYSLNTLVATLNIRDGLIMAEDAESISVSDDILNRLVNSAYGEGDAAVANITWVTGDGKGLVAGTLDAPFAASVDLETEVANGVPQSKIKDFYAEGFAGSDADVFYFTSSKITSDVIYSEVVTGSELSAEKNYYYAVGEDFVRASEDELLAWGEENQVPLYEKVGHIAVKKAGQYAFSAQGAKYDKDGHKIGGGATAETAVVVVPEAVSPKSVKIVGLSTADIPEGYSFDPALENTVFIDEENGTKLTAVAEFDGTVGAVSFDWAVDDVVVADGEYKVEDALSAELSLPYVAADGTEYKDGNYRVIVNHFKNGTDAPVVNSDVYVVSYLASKIDSVRLLANGAVVNESVSFNSGKASSKNVEVSAELSDELARSKSLTYSWYRTGELSDNAVWEKVASGTNKSYKVGVEGYYHVVIENNYNGSIYTYTSPDFYAFDTVSK